MEKLKIVCWDLILKLSMIGSGMIPISLGPQLVELQIELLDQFSILILAKQKLRSMREMQIICMEATYLGIVKIGIQKRFIMELNFHIIVLMVTANTQEMSLYL